MVRCFLVGAGASNAIGKITGSDIPTDKSFFTQLRIRNPVLYGNINRILKSQFANIQEIDDFTLEAIEDYADKVDSKYKNQLNLELKKAVFLLLGIQLDTQQPMLLQNLKRGVVSTPNLQLYYLILDNLSQGDFFVTLNYDILLDLAILSHGKSIHYGNHLKELYSGSDRWPPGAQTSISLYKPHGSLNWDERMAVFEYAVDPSKISIATRLSVVNDKRLVAIWQKAKEDLPRADELTVIGCSLSKQDTHLMEFIEVWKCKDNARNTKTKIIYLQQDKQTFQEHYNEVFKGYQGNLLLNPDGFDERSITFIFD